MDGSFGNFLKYNNAVPIFFGILFLGTTGVFAASPEVRDAVYSETPVVHSVDNTYILSADLDTYPFAMRVTEVTEDADYFYVAYDFDTIELAEYVWQDVVKKNTLRISKSLLGTGELEKYVESELAQVRAHEVRRLKETQAYEKNIGMSQKVVATVYAGLVGKFLETSSESFPVYTPPPQLNPNDPLYIANPQPSLTWDENAVPPPVYTPPPVVETPPPPAPSTPPQEPPAEEPPAEEPPVEEVPAETPPQEVPSSNEGEQPPATTTEPTL